MMNSHLKRPWSVNPRNDEILAKLIGEMDENQHIPWLGPVRDGRPRLSTTEGVPISPYRYIAASLLQESFDDTLSFTKVCDSDSPCLNPDHIKGLTLREKALFTSKIVKNFDTTFETQFTEEEVKEIRELHKTMGPRNISVIYGVSEKTIEEIVYLKNYAHVTQGQVMPDCL